MSNPTSWKEFRDKVEADMKEKGISEDTPICWIDISYPDEHTLNTVIEIRGDQDGIVID